MTINLKQLAVGVYAVYVTDDDGAKKFLTVCSIEHDPAELFGNRKHEEEEEEEVE